MHTTHHSRIVRTFIFLVNNIVSIGRGGREGKKASVSRPPNILFHFQFSLLLQWLIELFIKLRVGTSYQCVTCLVICVFFHSRYLYIHELYAIFPKIWQYFMRFDDVPLTHVDSSEFSSEFNFINRFTRHKNLHDNSIIYN